VDVGKRLGHDVVGTGSDLLGDRLVEGEILARNRDSFARTSSSTRRRSTNWPTWLPRAPIVASRRSSGSCASSEKNSMTPTTPRGLRSGKPNAA
jgi:hypothetical protein